MADNLVDDDEHCFIVFESFDCGFRCETNPILVTLSEESSKKLVDCHSNWSYKKFDLYD